MRKITKTIYTTTATYVTKDRDGKLNEKSYEMPFKASDLRAQAFLRRNLGDKNILVTKVDVTENEYAMTLDDFVKHATKATKSEAANTEVK